MKPRFCSLVAAVTACNRSLRKRLDNMTNWFVYIVECVDGSLYTGITNDIEKRVAKHNSKNGAKSIRGRLPVTLAYQERYGTKSEALKRENEVKRWSRARKLLLLK